MLYQWGTHATQSCKQGFNPPINNCMKSHITGWMNKSNVSVSNSNKVVDSFMPTSVWGYFAAFCVNLQMKLSHACVRQFQLSSARLPCWQLKFNYCKLRDNPRLLIGHRCPLLSKHSRDNSRRRRRRRKERSWGWYKESEWKCETGRRKYGDGELRGKYET